MIFDIHILFSSSVFLISESFCCLYYTEMHVKIKVCCEQCRPRSGRLSRKRLKWVYENYLE